MDVAAVLHQHPHRSQHPGVDLRAQPFQRARPFLRPVAPDRDRRELVAVGELRERIRAREDRRVVGPTHERRAVNLAPRCRVEPGVDQEQVPLKFAQADEPGAADPRRELCPVLLEQLVPQLGGLAGGVPP